jgi:hypothetical protein
MRATTVFCVQAYERTGLRLAAGRRRLFTSASEAEHVGERLSATVTGLIVYAVEGDPDVELWGEEAVFAKHGIVPRIEY